MPSTADSTDVLGVSTPSPRIKPTPTTTRIRRARWYALVRCVCKCVCTCASVCVHKCACNRLCFGQTNTQIADTNVHPVPAFACAIPVHPALLCMQYAQHQCTCSTYSLVFVAHAAPAHAHAVVWHVVHGHPLWYGCGWLGYPPLLLLLFCVPGKPLQQHQCRVLAGHTGQMPLHCHCHQPGGR